jgi:TonB family protein
MYFASFTRTLVAALLVSTQFCSPVRDVRDTTIRSAYDALPRQDSKAPARGFAGCAVMMLTDTEGVTFNTYLRDVYVSVKKRWFSNMPSSLEKGQQGINAVEFHILQDGSVPKDSVKMVGSSDKSDFDRASLQGIREAAPFNHLPEKFSKPFIELRFTFYYNRPLPRN